MAVIALEAVDDGAYDAIQTTLAFSWDNPLIWFNGPVASRTLQTTGQFVVDPNETPVLAPNIAFGNNGSADGFICIDTDEMVVFPDTTIWQRNSNLTQVIHFFASPQPPPDDTALILNQVINLNELSGNYSYSGVANQPVFNPFNVAGQTFGSGEWDYFLSPNIVRVAVAHDDINFDPATGFFDLGTQVLKYPDFEGPGWQEDAPGDDFLNVQALYTEAAYDNAVMIYVQQADPGKLRVKIMGGDTYIVEVPGMDTDFISLISIVDGLDTETGDFGYRTYSAYSLTTQTFYTVTIVSAAFGGPFASCYLSGAPTTPNPGINDGFLFFDGNVDFYNAEIPEPPTGSFLAMPEQYNNALRAGGNLPVTRLACVSACVPLIDRRKDKR